MYFRAIWHLWTTNTCFFQGNSSDSPVPSTSESSTPSSRRHGQTPPRARPHISYSPLVCHTHSCSPADDGARTLESECVDTPWEDEGDEASDLGQVAAGSHGSTPHQYLTMQDDGNNSPDSAGVEETLTFEAAVATSLGRSNTISSASQMRQRWQVPNGHFRKRLTQASSLAGCELFGETNE